MIEETGVPKDVSNRFSYSRCIGTGALAGTALGMFFIVLYALTRKTIHKPEDLTGLANMKNLGTLPHVATKRRDRGNKEGSRLSLLNESISLPFREDLYKIRTRAEKLINNKEMKVILVTSALPGEGKSTFSFNLALAMAEEDKKILLIDCDFHRPFIKDMVPDTDYTFGLDDVIKGNVSLNDAIQYHEKLGMSVLACSRPVDNASEILGSRIMYDFISGLKSIYDYIIMDTAPSAILADTLDLARIADGAIFIIKQNFSTVRPILEALDHLTESSSIEIIGYVLNDVNTVFGSYGLGYYGLYGSYGYQKKKKNHKLIKEEE
jgi:capsular exopolysaccharide synthesis family protein